MPTPIEAVADFYGYRTTDITGVRRTERLARARHVAMWLMRRAGQTYPQIGRRLNRDHSTVWTGVRRIEAEMDFTPMLAAELEALIGAVAA